MALADTVDMSKVRKLALAGADALAEVEPATARRIRRAIGLMDGVSLTVAVWEDGEAAIAVAGVEVWRGPRTLVDLTTQ